MYVTLDFTMKESLKKRPTLIWQLISEGQTLEVMKTTQVKPVAIVKLPHQCDDLVDWTFNNGILDITLKLTPQGSATQQKNSKMMASMMILHCQMTSALILGKMTMMKMMAVYQ